MIWINWRLVQIWTLCTLLGIAAFSVTGCGKMKRGWSIEPPDPVYATGPTQTGHTVVLPNLTPEVAHALCQQQGTFSDAQKGYGVACYIPSLDAIAVPATKNWPDEGERQEMIRHEFSHARGERHNADGTGVNWATSLPPVGWLQLTQGRPVTAGTEPSNPARTYIPVQPPAAAIAAWQRQATMTAPAMPSQPGPTTVPPSAPSGFGFAVRSGR